MDESPSLEAVQAELEEEERKWQKQGLGLNSVNFGELGPMLFDMTIRIQALTNVLITKGVMNNDDINLQYKIILLNNMRMMRESAPKQEADALRRKILEGIQMPPNGMKPPWER